MLSYFQIDYVKIVIIKICQFVQLTPHQRGRCQRKAKESYIKARMPLRMEPVSFESLPSKLYYTFP